MMIEKIFQSIKSLFTDPGFQKTVADISFYLFIIGLGAVLILTIILIIKVNKDIKNLDNSKRKRDKTLLRFLSNKKNRTY